MAVIRTKCLRCDSEVELPANYCKECRKEMRGGMPGKPLLKILGFLALLLVMTFLVLHFGHILGANGILDRLLAPR